MEKIQFPIWPERTQYTLRRFEGKIPFGLQSSPPVCRKLADTTDGLSKTMMIGEMSGRPWLYLASGQQVSGAAFPSYVSPSSADVAGGMPLNYGWGAWATTTTSTWARGAPTEPCRAATAPSIAAITAASSVFTPTGPVRPSATAPSTCSAGRCRRPSTSPWSRPAQARSFDVVRRVLTTIAGRSRQRRETT